MRGPRSTRRRRSLTAWSATRPVLSLETGWAKGLSSNDFGSGGGPAAKPPTHPRRCRRRSIGPRRELLRAGRRLTAPSVHPDAGNRFPAPTASREMVARRRRAHRCASDRYLAHRTHERAVSGRVLRRRGVDRQCPGDGAAIADTVVSEHRPSPGRGADAPDLGDGFLAAVESAKLPGGERHIGNSAGNRRARGNVAADAAPHAGLYGAFRESDAGWFQIDRNRHRSL